MISLFARFLSCALCGWLAFSGSVINAQPDRPHIEEVISRISPLLEEGHFPGAAVAVLSDGEPVHISTHGFANLGHRAPVTSETVFELASLTKHMTALAVLDLARQDRLSLADEVTGYIEDAPPQWAGITVGHLLSHMGGLEHRFERKIDDEFVLSYTTRQMLESARGTPTLSPPGTDWHYSDQGYFLLGMVIEKVTGTSFEDHMNARFFEIAGMRQTLLLDQSAIIPNLAQGYIFEEGELKRGRRVWQFGLTSHFGVLSSLDDLMRWDALLADTKGPFAQIDRDSRQLQRAFTSGSSCKAWGYARGWWVVDTGESQVAYHAGYSGTAYIRDVTSGVSVIVLTNREVSQGLIEPMVIAWAALNAIDPTSPSEGYRCWE